MGLSGKLLQIIALPGVVIIIFAIVAAEAAAAPTTTASIPTKAKPVCPTHCGDVEIPFPFGFTEGCYLDDSFRITCENSSTPNSPMIGNIRVRNISTDTHEILVMNWVGRECYQSNNSYYTNKPWIRLSKYTISNSKNRFTVIGCDTIAYLSGYQNGEEFKIGCSSQCPTPTNVGNGFCSGVGCCEVRFPYGLKNISIQVQSFNNHENVRNFNPCGYAFVVEKGQFNFSATYLQNYTNQTVPLVLDWAVGNLTCEEARNKPNFACKDITTTQCINILGGYRCQCKQGYRGNPYLLQGQGGCDDIDECLDGTHNCTNYCFNIEGNYTCGCPKLCRGDGRKDGEGCPVDVALAITVSIGIAIGLTSMLGGSWWLYLEFQARISIKLKANFYRQNGGSALKKRLQGSTAKKAKIFTSEELKEATNNYDKGRIIGKGVYKGFLPDNTIVIKKSKTVDPDQAHQFINKIIQLFEIDHKNVVKLFGCCLETEDPLLVYEFVSERTLFTYIYGEDNTSTKRWETSLRIAVETADALSYLHSVDIIHGDVKPSNILLGDNFTAKVSDFGISKLVPHDQNDVATVVQQIHGYLDPEYLQTNQLTEKSDVYSFGVVLKELLIDVGPSTRSPSTRSKKRRMILTELLTDVAPSTRSKKRRNVVKYFLSLLKEILLSELPCCDIDEEGNKDIDEEGNKDVDEEGNKDMDEEGNKDIDEEGNKDVDEEGNKDVDEGNKDMDEEGNKEQIKEVNKFVERCLRLKGDERPTMEKLKNELEGILRKTKTHSSVNAHESNLEKQAEHDLPGADVGCGSSICNISLGCWPMNVGM